MLGTDVEMIAKCLIRLTLPVVILVVFTRAQEDSPEDHYSEDHYFPGSDSENSPVDSGFVTPLDFSPLFADGAYGIAPAEPAPVAAISKVALIPQVPQQQSQYASAFDTVAAGSHNILQPQQDASEKYFSPANFGYKTFFAQPNPAHPKPAALQQQPQRYQHNIIQYDRTKGLAQSGALLNIPHQYNIQTQHDPTYSIHRPDQSDENQQILSALKKNPTVAAYFKPPSTKIEINHPTDVTRHANDKDEPQYQRYKTQHVGPGNANYKDHAYVSGARSNPSHRVRRYTSQRNSKQSSNKRGHKEEDDDSPYEYHSVYSSKPKSFSESPYSSYKLADDEKEDDPYKYDYGSSGYNFDEYERIKNLSEKQAAEIKQNPENCKEVLKDSMKCMVCANPKTGGNYESCAYVSEPKNNKYAYMKERKYDSNDDPQPVQKEEVEKEEAQPKQSSKYQESTPRNTGSAESRSTEAEEDAKPTTSRKTYDSTYKAPTQYAKIKQYDDKKPYQGYQRDPSDSKSSGKYVYYPGSHKSAHYTDASNEEEKEKEKKSPNKGGNPYEYKNPIPGFYRDNEPKKDVEKVLAEFAKKDRSACKKTYKNGMTCYQCIDKTGLKNEECMFVQESAPIRSHLAYQELKEFTSKPETVKPDGQSVAESQIVTTPNPNPLPKRAYSASLVSTERYGQKLKRTQPDVYTTTATTVIPRSQSGHVTSTQPSAILSSSAGSVYPRKSPIIKRSNSEEKETEVATPSESNIAPPEDFAGANSKGAFWAEMVPRFSRSLGVSLPEYMLTKSEHEQSFDEAVAGG